MDECKGWMRDRGDGGRLTLVCLFVTTTSMQKLYLTPITTEPDVLEGYYALDFVTSIPIFDGTAAFNALIALGETEAAKSLCHRMSYKTVQVLAGRIFEIVTKGEREYQGAGPEKCDSLTRGLNAANLTLEKALAKIREAATWLKRCGDYPCGVLVSKKRR